MTYFSDKPDFLRAVFARYPDTERGRRSALMPLLREVQDRFGYVSEPHMEEIASLVGTTATEVRSVMSFYSTYHTVPTGRFHLQVCSTLMCAQAGSDELWDAITTELDVQPGEVSSDGLFSVQKVECLGSCGTAPVVQLNDDGYYERVGPSKCARLLAAMRAGQAPAFDSPLPTFVQGGRQVLASGEAVGATTDDLAPLTGGAP
ncbi:complex I 24 kDa subunit family protein [Deinococcus pimensis]|uniref:complex I 24 kDa subunit family protein n=1 Tax=Deinococcus pimensis TaxID=309888 RepID=UPI0004816DF8|nr:NADH-quinone oxidoreductase subunit NuoE [Deinococcus pimensis]